MSNIKNPQRFAELEYSLQKYFDGKVASVMAAVKNDLQKKQVDELRNYQKSAAGILTSVDSNGMSMNSGYDRLKLTGQWNSKTVEDYVQMVNTKLIKDGKVQKDFAMLAAEWRAAVVKEIGRPRYDQLSNQLGTDLAYAYVGQRMDDLMMNKLVKDNMPKSTAEYIIRKTAQGSIWGLGQELNKSPLAREIEERGEKAFKPSKGAKVAGKLGGSVVDAATLGIGSWKSFAYYVGGDVVINSIMGGKKPEQQKELAMEAAISKGVFGSNTNVFTGFRQQSSKLQGKDNQYLNSLNSKLNNKIATPFKPLMSFNLLDNSKTAWKPMAIPGAPKVADRSQGKYKDVPLIVAPGQEDAYLAAKAKAEAQEKAAKEKKSEPKQTKAEKSTATDSKTEAQSSETKTEGTKQTESTSQNQSEQSQQSRSSDNSSLATTASNGWEQLLQASGMKGIGGTMSNLGYVISMLPDVLIGMFTGKTQSLNMKNTMMPIASILLGMFVKNPILKMALIGLGGANLLNKAGKESLNWQKEDAQQARGQAQNAGYAQTQYRQYADEPLNPRITNPVLQGTTLIANIDRVPCNIQLTQNVVAAYQAGALPLNTLANAVLNKYDANRMAAQQQYGQVEQQAIQQQQTEVIHRSR